MMSHLVPLTSSLLAFSLQLLFFQVSLSLLVSNNNASSPQCPLDQKSILLQLKNGFKQNRLHNVSSSQAATLKLDSWNPDTDCCSWEGITCDGTTGHVIELDLSGNSITLIEGRIDSSLPGLATLKRLNLAHNYFRTPIPSGLDQLTNLTHLNLSCSAFVGQIPLEISLLPRLVSLDLSNNHFVHSHCNQNMLTLRSPNLKALVQNLTSLTELHLDGVNILANGNDWAQALVPVVTNLQTLGLSGCNLLGPIDSSLSGLHSITELRLESNNLSTEVPNFLATLSSLRCLSLHNCELHGRLPKSIFLQPSLQILDVSNNPLLTISLPEFPPKSAFQQLHLYNTTILGKLPDSLSNLKFLTQLWLSNCNLSGPLPASIGSLVQLEYLSLFSNNFSGPIPLSYGEDLQHLTLLYLNKNSLEGFVPSSLFSHPALRFLDLSHNLLESVEHPLPNVPWSLLEVVDFHSNKFRGSLPILPPQVYFQDYSNNSFSTIPLNISFTFVRFFSVSGNSISGEIPLTVCDARYIEALDLSNNNFSGNIPKCLGEIGGSLRVLNLRRNAFRGLVPETFEEGCRLETINLDTNQLDGPIPRKLANCKTLEVLDLGSNQMNGTFPFWLQNLTYLRILILRSNKFYGPISISSDDNPVFPFLQIFDISSNLFTGNFPPKLFLNWQAMQGENGSQLNSKDQIVRFRLHQSAVYYQDSVTMTIKGLNVELVKILTALTVVDLSNNRFQGEISKSIGNLKLLLVLNFSHNEFIGPIPPSMGNLMQLESLDLSRNKLTGEIPRQLSDLTFLAVLNLSQNLLVGQIPQSNQFSTFTNNSFLGNVGLCGPPLSKRCLDQFGTPVASNSSSFGIHKVGEIDWEMMWIGFGPGFGVGVGVVFWTLVLWRKGSRKYMQLIDEIFQKFSFE